MILAIAHYKGGVGKSMTAIALGCAWHSRRKRVVIVDADEQGTVARWACESNHAAGLEIPDYEREKSEAKIKHRPHVFELPAGKAIVVKVPGYAECYDHVLIDTPPRLGRVTRAALAIADVAVMPIGPGGADAWPLEKTLQLLEDARAVNPRLQPFYLLAKFDSRSRDEKATREALADTKSYPVLRSSLSLQTTYHRSVTVGSDPTSYDTRGVVTKEIADLAGELSRKHAAWQRRA